MAQFICSEQFIIAILERRVFVEINLKIPCYTFYINNEKYLRMKELAQVSGYLAKATSLHPSIGKFELRRNKVYVHRRHT